ncbi:MAG TPA: hypothetical protein VH257_02190, partial [Chloroflexota bacterium]|nr:hypothetical protein [Chloroflexota bacterium]
MAVAILRSPRPPGETPQPSPLTPSATTNRLRPPRAERLSPVTSASAVLVRPGWVQPLAGACGLALAAALAIGSDATR